MICIHLPQIKSIIIEEVGFLVIQILKEIELSQLVRRQKTPFSIKDYMIGMVNSLQPMENH